jgi:hypothetical protein
MGSLKQERHPFSGSSDAHARDAIDSMQAIVHLISSVVMIVQSMVLEKGVGRKKGGDRSLPSR